MPIEAPEDCAETSDRKTVAESRRRTRLKVDRKSTRLNSSHH